VREEGGTARGRRSGSSAPPALRRRPAAKRCAFTHQQPPKNIYINKFFQSRSFQTYRNTFQTIAQANMSSTSESTSQKSSWGWWLSAAAVVGIAVASMHVSVDTVRSLSLRSTIPVGHVHQAHNYARLYTETQHHLDVRQEPGCNTEACGRITTLCAHDLPTPKYVRCINSRWLAA